MASKRSPQTAAKRDREQAVRERRILKAEKRAARKADEATTGTSDATDVLETADAPEARETTTRRGRGGAVLGAGRRGLGLRRSPAESPG